MQTAANSAGMCLHVRDHPPSDECACEAESWS